MDEINVATLLQDSVAKITERLPDLSREQLVELSALEAATEAPRSTLQAAIDKRLAELDADPDNEIPPAVVESGEPAAKAAGKLDKSHWMHPDYHGPITGDQAAWRIANIKPVEKVRTK